MQELCAPTLLGSVALRDPEVAIQLRAVAALGALGALEPCAAVAMADVELVVRQVTTEALGTAGAAQALHALCLGDAEPVVRGTAIEWLGRLGHVTLLARALADSHAEHRLRAVTLVGSLATASSSAAVKLAAALKLAEAATTDAEPRVPHAGKSRLGGARLATPAFRG